MRHRQFLSLVVLIVLLSACGGGGSVGATAVPVTPALVASTVHYPTGELLGQGQVDASGQREGAWTYWHTNGVVSWTASFKDDVFDEIQPWTEFNADGSIRFTFEDGPALNTPPK